MENGNEHSISPISQLRMGLLLEPGYLLANAVNNGGIHTIYYMEIVL